MDDLFEPPSEAFSKRLLKEYRESEHPRDEKGRWTAGGISRVAGGALTGGGALAAAAALGVPVVRNIPGLRMLRNKVLGARTVRARSAINQMNRGISGLSAVLGAPMAGGLSRHSSFRAQLLRGQMPAAGLKLSPAALRRLARG